MCRQRAEQGTLIRIGIGPEGNPVQVVGGGPEGRSAYLCAASECVGSPKAAAALGRTLKASVSAERFETLRNELICKLK